MAIAVQKWFFDKIEIYYAGLVELGRHGGLK